MQETLRLHLQDKQYRDIIERYHFAEHDLELLMQVGSLAEKAAEPVMYYGVFTQGTADDDGRNGELSTERLAVIVTLGTGVDELQNRFMSKECLTESYMIECIDMELLRIAYEQAAERIHAHTGKWISGFDFVGDKIPLGHMEDIFQLLAPQGVSYNQAYMMNPKKTVVFLTDLCDERKDSYCHICAGCTNLTCPNRMMDSEHNAEKLGDMQCKMESGRNLTYGYQRIFGLK